MIYASVIVASLALVFTVGSFYWLQARKGKLVVFPVATFSGLAADPDFLLRLPLVIFNTGARPRVVSGLRLRLRGDENALLDCHTFRKTLMPKSDDTADFFSPYVISGRDVVTKFAHFRGDGFSRLLSDQPQTFDLEVLHDGESKWKSIGALEVHTEAMYGGAYITYSNDSGVWSSMLLEEAKTHRDMLRTEREGRSDRT